MLISSGNGPSALILSYILHGHVPYYDPTIPHPDPLLHAKLKDCPSLLQPDVDHLTEHFGASRFSYSTQALPLNVLLDTLVRPSCDTDDVERRTNIEWRYMPQRAVSHVVIGNTTRAGGQWTDNPVAASWDIETLSYAGMLSLPGYSFDDHHQKRYGKHLPSYSRPTRRQVADYFAAYPANVGIADVIYCGENLENISRSENGFRIGSHGIQCKHLVLATGIFSELIPPRQLLKPLTTLNKVPSSRDSLPLLVVGSGFTAADVIISTPRQQKIIHIFKWEPDTRPSPLRACHQQAYPEYAGVYRRMKLAAANSELQQCHRPKMRRGSSTPFLESRDWEHNYEGLPNTAIVGVSMQDRSAIVTLEQSDGVKFKREVGGFAYVVGRRGSLQYLCDDLRHDVLSPRDNDDVSGMISGQSLRDKAVLDLEVAPNVFIIGSLTGDSLVRFAYGGCVYAAGKIISFTGNQFGNKAISSSTSNAKPKKSIPGAGPVMNGMAGHNEAGTHSNVTSKEPLDRRKPSNMLTKAIAEKETWRESGRCGGGFGIPLSDRG